MYKNPLDDHDWDNVPDAPCQRCNGSGRDTYVNPESPTGYTERACPACQKDACQFCLGAKGGVPGNENRMADVVLCDYCHVLLMKILKSYRAEWLRLSGDEKW